MLVDNGRLPLLPPFRGFRAFGQLRAFRSFRFGRSVPGVPGDSARLREGNRGGNKEKGERGSSIFIFQRYRLIHPTFIFIRSPCCPPSSCSIALHSPPLLSLRCSPSMPSVALHCPPSPPLRSQRQAYEGVCATFAGAKEALVDLRVPLSPRLKD